MAIQNRRGNYTDFDPTKMVAGEFAIVQSGDENTDDGKALYVAPTTGSVERIPFAKELEGLVEVDDTLTEAGAAADAKKTGDEITALKDDLSETEVLQKLLHDNVPGTIQNYTFTDGTVSKVEHKSGNDIVRSDVFTYGESSITEVRTLATGEALTIVTNLTNLETSVTYTVA